MALYMWIDGALILIPAISFLSSALLTVEPCCKFMLKNDIQNYLRQFTKILIGKYEFS